MDAALSRPAAKAAFIKALGGHLEAHGFREQPAGRGVHEFVADAAGGVRYLFRGTFTRSGDFVPQLLVQYPEVAAFVKTHAPWFADRDELAVLSTQFTDFLDAANADGYRNSSSAQPQHPMPEPLTEERMHEWANEFAATYIDRVLPVVRARTDSPEKGEALLNTDTPVKPPRYRFAGSQEWIGSVLAPSVSAHFIVGIILASVLERPALGEQRAAALQYQRRERRPGDHLFDLLEKVLAATTSS